MTTDTPATIDAPVPIDTPATMTAGVPETIDVDGTAWPVRRAWPAGEGRVAIEAALGERIRAGIQEDGRLTLLPPGEDPKLPGLARVLGEGVPVLGAGAHRAPARQAPPVVPSGPVPARQVPPGPVPPRVVSHRPGRRAVVRLADGTYAKCVRRGRARGIVDGIRRAQPFAAGFRMPELISVDESTVVLSRLIGTELHDPTRLSAGQWERAWAEVLDAWARAGSPAAASAGDSATGFTSGPTSRSAGDTATHTADDEIRVLREWRVRADRCLGPLLGAPVVAALDRGIDAVAVDLAASAGVWGPLHRDLHDKQLMWDPVRGPGLLDVDTACTGERELDLGNLRAHALWRGHQGIWSDEHAEVVVRGIAETASAIGADDALIDAYTRAALLRLVCVYAFRPRWRARIGALLDAAGG